MSNTITTMTEADRDDVCKMMRDFYNSPLVLSNGSEEIFNSDIDNCINGCPYLEGYMFKDGQTVQGYAMIAKSFSTEFGKTCIWIEDIYIKSEYRGIGIGGQFFELIEKKYPDSIFRLEVEEENEKAIKMYEKCGYEIIPYMEMIRK